MTLDLSWLVNLLLLCLGAVLTSIAGSFLSEFKELRKSVEGLNTNMSQVLEKLNHHEHRIERLEERI